ncbi:PRC-barrel domain-containing protein [Paenibacillus sp. TAB 01]|uniref:PRC-barrel domain-containing protein n=1 Tax=Paenibacillus sp. TAB 01 TaxID=3368988 RepID=UPI003751CA9C
MKRARDVIGLPVISVQSGKQIGTAKDILLGEDWKIKAVLLETKHWFTSPSCILWHEPCSYRRRCHYDRAGRSGHPVGCIAGLYVPR